MKIFKDPELKDEIKAINFGIVKTGESKTITVYLLNDSEGYLRNLVFLFPIPPTDLKIEDVPMGINPKQVAKASFKWTPSINFKKALKVPLLIQGDEIYFSEVEVS